jgi:hypothetical protein
MARFAARRRIRCAALRHGIPAALCFVILKVQGRIHSRAVNRFDPVWFECCVAMDAELIDERVRREADQDFRTSGLQGRIPGSGFAAHAGVGRLRLDDRRSAIGRHPRGCTSTACAARRVLAGPRSAHLPRRHGNAAPRAGQDSGGIDRGPRSPGHRQPAGSSRQEVTDMPG